MHDPVEIFEGGKKKLLRPTAPLNYEVDYELSIGNRRADFARQTRQRHRISRYLCFK